MSEQPEERSVYDIVGEKFFVDLVDAFYDGVETDPILIPLYPEGTETSGARHRLALFLVQYWGGPDTYMEERGHPRLRMRHAPYVIADRERDHWLMHMATAIENTIVDVNEVDREHVTMELANYMVNAAEHMRNV
jgi:hemoglobin